MVLQNADKFPSLYNKDGSIRQLIPNWCQCLIKLCFIALLINIIPLIAGFINQLVDEAELTLSFVTSVVSGLLLTFALPFARAKILHLFWQKRDVDDFEEETHVASLAGKQAFARPLAAWIEGVFVLINGVALSSFFDGGAAGIAFGSIAGFSTILHMVGYIGVFLNWLKYRSISDEVVDSLDNKPVKTTRV